MNWHVFNRDNPDTWPKLDCKFLVCGDNEELVVCKWDKALKCFYDDKGFAEYWECFYVTIGYLPYIKRELCSPKCMREYPPYCEYEDDGYCLCGVECPYKIEVMEYCLGDKCVWKEF